MSTFTTRQPTVRFTDTDGPVSFTATTGAVTFTAAYQSVTGSGGGGASDLDDLTDVTITSPASGDVIRYDGAVWENVTSIEAHGNTYQHTDILSTAAASYVMGVDDRIVITTGAGVVLPDAQAMEGQEVTIYAGNACTVTPYAGQSILGQSSYTIEATTQGANAAKFVAVDASAITGGAVTWTWVATLRSGPQWDIPDFQAETQGALLAVNDLTEPAWFDLGTASQILTVSGAGGALEWKSPSAISYGLTDADISHNGVGLFDTAETVGQGINAAEAALDRWQFVKAYSTTNVNLALYVGVGSVATQPTLDDGIAPPEDTACDVYLFGQSTAAENGLYQVNATTGVWTKYVEPTQFDPGNGHRVNCTENGANFIYLDDGIVGNVARSRRASDFAAASEASGNGQWYRMPDASATLTASPGGGTVDVVSNVATSTILGRTTAGSGDSEELSASSVRALLDLEVGTDVQAYDAELAAIAGLTSAADRLPYFTGSGAAALATFTSAGRALVDDATAAAQLATLGAAPTAAYYVAGNYYSPPGVTSGGTRAIASGGTGAIPFRIGKACTVDGLQVDLSAAGAASYAVDLHLMSCDSTGFPTSSVFTVSVTTTGTGTQVLSATTTGVAVTPGLYWAVIHNRSAGSVTPRAVAAGCHVEPMPAQTSSSANQLSGYTASPGTSAITSHPALGSSTAVNQAPIISFRAA